MISRLSTVPLRALVENGQRPSPDQLASLLVVGQAAPPRFTMKKCCVLRLDRVGGGWTVRWHLSPEVV